MSETLYEVVFHGKLVDGFSPADAKANVARLFKASEQQVEQMFSGRRVVIRNQLDQETALKYQALLRKNGVVCQVELPKSTDTAPSAEPAQAQTPAKPSPAEASPAPAATAPAKASPTPPPAAKPNPFLQDSSTPRAPASETGRLPVAGKKVDAILADLHLTLAPTGSRMSEGEDLPPPPAPDTQHLSVAPVGVRLVENQESPPPIVPDIGHLSVAPLGTRLADPKPDE